MPTPEPNLETERLILRAPRPEDFGRLLDKIGESMSKDFDFSREMRSLQVPTLLVCACTDSAAPFNLSRNPMCRP